MLFSALGLSSYFCRCWLVRCKVLQCCDLMCRSLFFCLKVLLEWLCALMLFETGQLWCHQIFHRAQQSREYPQTWRIRIRIGRNKPIAKSCFWSNYNMTTWFGWWISFHLLLRADLRMCEWATIFKCIVLCDALITTHSYRTMWPINCSCAPVHVWVTHHGYFT